MKKLIEGYKNYTGSDLSIQKKPRALGTTLNKIDLENPYNINKYISFLGQLMWYTTKVGHNVANAASDLKVHMSHTGQEHWKALGCLIGYLKVK